MDQQQHRLQKYLEEEMVNNQLNFVLLLTLKFFKFNMVEQLNLHVLSMVVMLIQISIGFKNNPNE